jgi:16S rRNA G527 N7-methylase RsmG
VAFASGKVDAALRKLEENNATASAGQLSPEELQAVRDAIAEEAADPEVPVLARAFAALSKAVTEWDADLLLPGAWSVLIAGQRLDGVVKRVRRT